MKQTINFFKWFKKIGGRLDYFDVEAVFKSCERLDVPVSSFKARSEEIKLKYNYRFK